MGSPVTEFHLGAHGGEQATGGFDVAYLRNVFEDDGVFRKQGRGHARQGGIFRAADANRAEKRSTPADD